MARASRTHRQVEALLSFVRRTRTGWSVSRSSGRSRARGPPSSESLHRTPSSASKRGAAASRIAMLKIGTFEAHLADAAAVIDNIDAPTIDLVGGSGGALSGMVAIAYAAAHPERVRTLALFGTTARPVGPIPPLRRAIYKLADLDFDFYKQVMALRAFGWEDGRTVAEGIASVGREELDFGRRGWLDADVSDLLSKITCPALVGHLKASGVDLAPLSASRNLAAALPNAELRVVEVNLPSIFDSEGTAVDALLSLVDHTTTDAERPAAHGTAIILFTDIADSTALTERLGDAAFRERARTLDDALRTIIARQRRHRDRGQAARRRRHGDVPGGLAGDRRARSPARPPATARRWRCTSACTPATSSASATTSTAAPSTSPRASAASPRPARSSSPPPSATSPAPPPA